MPSGDAVVDDRSTTPSEAGSDRDSLDPVDVQFILAQALHAHAVMVQDDKEVDDMLSAEPQPHASFDSSGMQTYIVEPPMSTSTTTSDRPADLAEASTDATSELQQPATDERLPQTSIAEPPVSTLTTTSDHPADLAEPSTDATTELEQPATDERLPQTSIAEPPVSTSTTTSDHLASMDIDEIRETSKPGKRKTGRRVANKQHSAREAVVVVTQAINEDGHSVGVSRSGRARKPTAKAMDNPE